MLKKIIVAALFLLPVAGFAQNFKFGNIDTQAIFEQMPERQTVQKELEALNTKYETELQKMSEEYEKKVSELVNSKDSLPDNIKTRRAQEIGELEQRIQNFRQVAYQDFQQQQQQKMAPIYQKIMDAIKSVGEENGFTYIFEQGSYLFASSSNTVDVLPLVKAKLGLK
jgi:outer membrane protein